MKYKIMKIVSHLFVCSTVVVLPLVITSCKEKTIAPPVSTKGEPIEKTNNSNYVVEFRSYNNAFLGFDTTNFILTNNKNTMYESAKDYMEESASSFRWNLTNLPNNNLFKEFVKLNKNSYNFVLFRIDEDARTAIKYNSDSDIKWDLFNNTNADITLKISWGLTSIGNESIIDNVKLLIKPSFGYVWDLSNSLYKFNNNDTFLFDLYFANREIS